MCQYIDEIKLKIWIFRSRNLLYFNGEYCQIILLFLKVLNP